MSTETEHLTDGLPALSLFELESAGLKTDKNTVRIHDQRNLETIDGSVDETGYLRSIVVDEENNVLCGKGLVTVAEKRGGANILYVDVTDDNTIVAVRKHGLTPRQKVRAMLYDNRASDLSRDNKKEIGRLTEEAPDQLLLDGIYTEREQQKLLRLQADAQPMAEGGSHEEGDPEQEAGGVAPAASGIKVISIFATDKTHPELVRKLKTIGAKIFDGETVTSKVAILLIEKAYADWIGEPEVAVTPTFEEGLPLEDSSAENLPE